MGVHPLDLPTSLRDQVAFDRIKPARRRKYACAAHISSVPHNNLAALKGRVEL